MSIVNVILKRILVGAIFMSLMMLLALGGTFYNRTVMENPGDQSVNHIREELRALQRQKSVLIFQENVEEEKYCQKILDKLEKVSDSSLEVENAVGVIRNLLLNFDNLLSIIGSTSIKPDQLDRRVNDRKRDFLSKTFQRVLKSKQNLKTILNKSLPIVSLHLEPYENEKLQSFIKNKMRKIIRLVEVEKKIQYELNRFKFLSTES